LFKKLLPGILLCIFLCSFSTPEGIYYQHIVTDVPQSIHLLEVNPQKFSLVAARALDKCVGRENVLSLSQRKKALGGVNGGYFDIGVHEGAPSGILKVEGQWYGLPFRARGAIGWSTTGKEILFDRVLTHLEGIDFHIDPQIDKTTAERWDAMDHIVGGVPLLIKGGKRITDFFFETSCETFITLRHARTAVGLLPNGNLVFVVVDGKQPGFSLGMTMDELVIFMEQLGCTDALNLDGGGSSTFIYENEVINQPTGDGDMNDEGVPILRAVSDAILILEK
jgi:hypothetical protein